MWAILFRVDGSKVEEREAHYEGHRHSSGRDHVRELWTRAKQELDIPNTPPVEVDLPSHELFGGDFPEDPQPCPDARQPGR